MFGWLKKKGGVAPAANFPSVQELRETLAPMNQAASWGNLSFETWGDVLGASRSHAGQIVNAETAMRISAVFACVRLISGAASCSRVLTYKGDDDTRTPNPKHSLANMLRLRPNRHMTASTFWKFFLACKILQGNAYANIIRGRNWEPIALYPVNPRNVTVHFAWELGLDASLGVEKNRLFYGVTLLDGGYKLFDQDDMLHVPNILSSDGKTGQSTVRSMSQAAGLALAAEQSSAEFFANGMQFDKAIIYPNKVSTEAAQKLREYWSRRHSGAANHHIPPILTEGGDIKQLSMSSEDAQLLESRKFSVIDICRFFGVPPVMIGETEKTSSWGSGVEQMAKWFATFTMNEHFTAIEQELSAKLFRGDGSFAEFDESEITRGDTKTRAEYFKSALGSMQQPGWMTQNEVRAQENLPPVQNGDILQAPDPTKALPNKGDSNV